MKEYRLLNPIFFALMIGLICFTPAPAQTNPKDKNDQKSTQIAEMIQSKRFVFIAQNAAPLGGRNINLTSAYDLRLSSDTIISQLPYFGRAFVAPINPSEGGISFTSTDFNYTINPRKKGGWEIVVVPKDTRDVRQLFLTVSENGYASLQVTSNNKQPINFTGYITSKDQSR